jgi:hypothetical protein
MAATAAYITVSRVPLDGVPHDSKTFSNIATTSAAFDLKGGLYVIKVKASTYGTVTLQVLGPDGTTWLNALTAISADGTAAGYLAPDNYRILIA